MVARADSKDQILEEHHGARAERQRRRRDTAAAQLHPLGSLLVQAVPAPDFGLGLRVQYHSGLVIPPREFDQLVEQALDELPASFMNLLDTVAGVVEEETSDEDYDILDDPHNELLGMFRRQPPLPAQIVIFRGPI